MQKIAKLLQQATRRAADLAARYGGEEFAVILPNTDSQGALFIAKNITQLLAQLQISHEKSPVSQYITCSIGIATKIPTSGQPVTNIIKVADNLLYEAKKAGRNQITHNNP